MKEHHFVEAYSGALRCCTRPLVRGGIVIAEEGFGANDSRMENLLGIEGLNSIDMFTYEQRNGDRRPKNTDFAFYEKVR